jgi:hypothetical protein
VTDVDATDGSASWSNATRESHSRMKRQRQWKSLFQQPARDL